MGHKKSTILTVLFSISTISCSLFAQDLSSDSTVSYNNLQQSASGTKSEASSGNDQKSNYQKLLLQASNQFKKKNYSEARKLYVNATALDPEAKIAKSKIEEIDGILKKQQSSTAKSGSNASVLNRKDENYWKDKYAEIKSILEGLPDEKESKNKPVTTKAKVSENDKGLGSSEATTLKKNVKSTKDPAKSATPKGVKNVLMDRADSAIAMGDSMLSAKDYKQSLEYYKEAHSLKPENAYAARMVANVESVLYDIAEKQKKTEELKLKAQINEYLDLANKAIVDKNWQTAKDLYLKILDLKPAPAQKDFALKKIETIDLELERIASRTPPKKEPEVVKKPKNKREARAMRKEAERSAILAGASGKTASVKDENLVDGPTVDYKILQQFSIDFNEATSVKWTEKTNFFQVDFLNEGKKTEAFYNIDGTLLGSSSLRTKSDLPSNIIKTLEKKYSEYKLGDVIYFEGPEEIAYYIAAEGQKGKVIFRAVRSGDVSFFNRLSENYNQGLAFGIQSNSNVPQTSVVDKPLAESEKRVTRDAEKPKAKQKSLKAIPKAINDNPTAALNTSAVDPPPAITPSVVSSAGSINGADKIDSLKITEDLNLSKSFQKEAIEYSRADLMKKYPLINFDKIPDGQLFDVSVDENKLEYGLISDRVLKGGARLNLVDNNNDIKVVCQDITFNGNNAYIKLLIDNNSDQDFLTGAIKFTFLKENGSLRKLNPRFISNFPVVMPGKKFAIVYVTGVPSIVNPGDVFVIDVADRMKQTNLSINIPGDVYNAQKRLLSSAQN